MTNENNNDQDRGPILPGEEETGTSAHTDANLHYSPVVDDHSSNSHDGEGESIHEPPKVRDFVMKTLVIILVIVLIFLGSWGIVKLVPSLASALASVSVSISSIFKPKVSPSTTPIAEVSPSPTVTPSEPGVVYLPEPTAAVTATSSTSTPGTGYPVAYVPSGTPSGTASTRKADLAVRVLNTGVIDKTTGIYSVRSVVDASERAAVQFEVTNIGGKASGGWTFSALLPKESAQKIYTSPLQHSLGAGDAILYTMGFDNIESRGQVQLLISVDEGNLIPEIREDNNLATAYFNVTGVSYQSQYQYPQYQYTAPVSSYYPPQNYQYPSYQYAPTQTYGQQYQYDPNNPYNQTASMYNYNYNNMYPQTQNGYYSNGYYYGY